MALVIDKLKDLSNYLPNIVCESLNDKNMVYVAGYYSRKWWHNHYSNKCKRCHRVAMSSTELNRCFNTQLIDVKNKGGLVYPSIHVIKIVALCIDVVNTIIRDKKNLTIFQKASTNGVVCVNALKSIMIKRVHNAKDLKHLLTEYSLCGKYRRESFIQHVVNTAYNISGDKLSKYLNRLSAINRLTLSMVKTKSKKNKSASIATNVEQTNSGNWSASKCKEFLEKFEAPKSGTKGELQETCSMIVALDKIDLGFIWSCKVAKLRRICEDLHVNNDVNRVDMLMAISKVILDPRENLNSVTLDDLIKEHEKCDDNEVVT